MARLTTMVLTSMYESAIRSKLRFDSTRGPLDLEALWQAPLVGNGRDGFDLNEIAKTIDNKLSTTSKNFVRREGEDETSPERLRLELAMNIVQHVIDTKLAEEDEKVVSKARKAEREELLQIKAERQKAKTLALSDKEIDRRLAVLEKD